MRERGTFPAASTDAAAEAKDADGHVPSREIHRHLTVGDLAAGGIARLDFEKADRPPAPPDARVRDHVLIDDGVEELDVHRERHDPLRPRLEVVAREHGADHAAVDRRRDEPAVNDALRLEELRAKGEAATREVLADLLEAEAEQHVRGLAVQSLADRASTLVGNRMELICVHGGGAYQIEVVASSGGAWSLRSR